MNRSPLRPLLVAAALLASGCMVVAHPAPAPMPPGQAVAIAADYARAQGLFIEYTLSSRLDRRGRWHVELAGVGGRDWARVVVDGYSGAILHARLRGPRGIYGPPPPYQGPPPGAPPQDVPPPPPGEGTPAPPAPPAESAPPPPSGTPGPTPAPPPG